MTFSNYFLYLLFHVGSVSINTGIGLFRLIQGAIARSHDPA